jgi:error-prone DNA polymerase
VLVRQKPGSAKGVLFITIEDETGVANLVIWPGLFEQQRRVVLGARMLGVDGRCSARARWSTWSRAGSRPVGAAGRFGGSGTPRTSHWCRKGAMGYSGDHEPGARHTGQARDAGPLGPKVRDIFIPDLTLEAIRVKPRDFR